MHKVRNKKRNKRLCKGIASLMVAALLLSQSSFLMHAEERNQEVWEDTVTDEEPENPGADGDIDTGTDTDTDTETVPGTSMDEETAGSDADGDEGMAGSDAGKETEDPDVSEGENTGADIDADAVSDVDADEEENIILQADEAENAGGEDAVSRTVENGFPDFNDNDGCQYRIISEENLQVELWRHSAGQSASGPLEIFTEASDGTNTYSVVRIGDHAFSGYDNLESITIPNGITSIGPYAFFHCDNLKSITIPDSVTRIEEYAFQNSGLENIIIPKEVTSIETHVFSGCKSLTNITIPDSVTSIGGGAFWGCSGLTSVTIPNSVTGIGWSAFIYCGNLQEVIIPDSVTSIGGGAFNCCYSLTGVTIPSGVTSIEDTTFSQCKSLTNVTIPANVTSIGHDAFWGCENLESVKILNDKINLAERAFCNCPKLSSLEIAVTESSTVDPLTVGSNCFALCSGDSLTFLTKDGTKELGDTTTPILAAAMKAYDMADGNKDGKWHEWNLPDAPEIPDNPDPVYYPVTITVKKDDGVWSDSDPGKTFALLMNGSTGFITNLTSVEKGKYIVFDSTGATDGADYISTGVEVEVNGPDAQAEVNYYTVTFYDGDTALPAYGRIVLKDTTVEEPSPVPEKKDYKFNQWMTAKDGGTEFDFDKRIEAKTDIYASWTAQTPETPDPPVVVKQYTIKASAGEGGSITPNGDVKVNAGEKIRFFLTPNDGYKVSSVLVDGKEELSSAQTAEYLRAGISDGQNNVKYYDFENVTRDHTLEVSFETTQAGGGDTGDEGNPGNTGNNSGSGNTGGGGTNGDSGSGGSGGTNGGSGSGSSGGGTDYNSGSGDFSGGGTDGNSSTGGSDNNISAISSDLSAASDAGIVKTSGTAPASGSKEPKTGDAFHVEVYAALAMIVGLFYLLLYFADGVGGMTEEEKRELIARLVRWAEKGKPVRKYVALAAIFMVLVYYHAIGKRTLADNAQFIAVER